MIDTSMGFFSLHFGGFRQHGARKGPFNMSFSRLKGMRWRRGKLRSRGQANVSVKVPTGPF